MDAAVGGRVLSTVHHLRGTIEKIQEDSGARHQSHGDDKHTRESKHNIVYVYYNKDNKKKSNTEKFRELSKIQISR